MSWRPHSRARVDARAPSAWGKCDRCGSIFNLSRLHYQREWAGAKLINKRLRVCSGCMDEPQPQLRTLHLTPDPVAVRDPRPLNNYAVMGGFAVMQRVAAQVSTTQGVPLVPGSGEALYNGLLSDSGFDAGSDATGQVQSVYVPAGEIGGDSGGDAGNDATVHGLPTTNVALELYLNVIAPAQDPGYVEPPFRDLIYDNSADAGSDAGIGEHPGIPVAIDPPED